LRGEKVQPDDEGGCRIVFGHQGEIDRSGRDRNRL